MRYDVAERARYAAAMPRYYDATLLIFRHMLMRLPLFYFHFAVLTCQRHDAIKRAPARCFRQRERCHICREASEKPL